MFRMLTALWLLPLATLLAAGPADAFPGLRNDWVDRYGAISPSADNAGCLLCHATSPGANWNAYGEDFRNARVDLACDLNNDGGVTSAEAFYCIEEDNSDNDGSGRDNLDEIGVGTQPGWTEGPTNTIYTIAGVLHNQLPPADIGPLDPDGTEPPPDVEPPPPSDEEPPAEDRWLQFVWPGRSIQDAIDRARPGGIILIFPGTYQEIADPTNGLNISKSLHLIGLPGWGWGWFGDKVVLANAGNQRNGIVAVPDDRQDCMDCHTSMAPPFPLHEDVEGELKMREPMIRGLTISGITIDSFSNNGLFTENVDGFIINNVESIDNKNYGIFPTLSKNGIIHASYATGSDDSGMWVETSENVRVTKNLVEGNTNGFEVSNSDDILLNQNEARDNTAGFAILLLPDIFDDRPGAKRIHIRDNWIHDNNKPNTARPGTVLATVPPGTGILHLGADDSEITGNVVERNDFTGIAIADYCLTVGGTPFDCSLDPSVTPEYFADQVASRNVVRDNLLVDNGLNPGAGNPFFFAAADLTLVTLPDDGNCYADNIFTTFFSFISVLPPCP